MTIKIVKDWYDTGTKLFKKKELELVPNNIYCICGCNGYGKTTLMNQIKENIIQDGTDLDQFYNSLFSLFTKEKTLKDNIVLYFNRKTKNAKNEVDAFRSAIMNMQLSNGEAISYNWGSTLQLFKRYLTETNNKNKTVWMFFDDIDSGTSIDMLQDFKKVIGYIIEDCKKINNNYYIILPINSYELTFFEGYNNICIDATTFQPLTFNNYDDYRKYILKTGIKKDKREQK